MSCQVRFERKLPIFILGIILGISNIDLRGQVWDSSRVASTFIGTGGNCGFYSSLLQISGKPAIAFQDATHGTLMFTMAKDSFGLAWNDPIVIDEGGTGPVYITLAIVSGKPAVCYFNGTVKYVRSLDSLGTIWAKPVTVITTGGSSWFFSMSIVCGKPAMLYWYNNSLKYIRAKDSLGIAWDNHVTIKNNINYIAQYLSFKVINKIPAVSYYDWNNQNLFYMQAQDSAGLSWNNPVKVASQGGGFCSLQEVKGKSAISYSGNSSNDLLYIQSLDSLGINWGNPVILDASGNVGYYSYLQTINEIPAVLYYDWGNKDFKYVCSLDSFGNAWKNPIIVANMKKSLTLTYPSLQNINGKPAITYPDDTIYNVQYLRAQDSLGISWGTPTAIDMQGIVGIDNSMQIVNGCPAISFLNESNFNLEFVKAKDSLGLKWENAIAVDTTGKVGTNTSFRMVNGHPAIAYYDITNDQIKYVRSSNSSGSNWNTPVLPDTICPVDRDPSLQIINGFPAIAYRCGVSLRYVRALDSLGISWGIPITLDNLSWVGEYASLQNVHGKPAISYYDQTNGNLKYVRALDSIGAYWGTAANYISIDVTSDNVGRHTSLLVVQGKPAISYYDFDNKDLKYVRALDSTGYSWGNPIAIDINGIVGEYTSLEMIKGMPAISYYDQTNRDLKYVRATDSLGNNWCSPVRIDAIKELGQYNSMINDNNNIFIASFNELNKAPSIVRGHFNPKIIQQPLNTSICSGTDSILQVSVSGFGLSYQWQIEQSTGFSDLLNISPYSNVTTPTLTITNSPMNLNGSRYRCLISGSCIPLEVSDTVLLSVKPSPTLTITASSLTVCIGNPVTLNASGNIPYTWSGGVMNNIAFTPSATTTYTVTGTASNGCTISNTITIFADPCIGISDIIKYEPVIISPNPTTGIFYLDFKEEIVRITITDVLGIKILQSEKQQSRSFDISFAPPGIYILLLEQENGILLGKIIKK